MDVKNETTEYNLMKNVQINQENILAENLTTVRMERKTKTFQSVDRIPPEIANDEIKTEDVFIETSVQALQYKSFQKVIEPQKSVEFNLSTCVNDNDLKDLCIKNSNIINIKKEKDDTTVDTEIKIEDSCLETYLQQVKIEPEESVNFNITTPVNDKYQVNVKGVYVDHCALVNIKEEIDDADVKSNLLTEEYDRLKREDVSSNCSNQHSTSRSQKLLKCFKKMIMKEKKKYTCPICSKDNASAISRTEHINDHFGKCVIICKLCGKLFICKSEFFSHFFIHKIRAVTMKKKEIDNLNVTNMSQTKTDSVNLKKFQCEICSKWFTYKYNMNVHMRYHTKEYLFKCEICLKQFVTKSRLNSHMNIHTGEKRFKCDICLKQFGMKNTLKIHMRIHTGEKSFKCEVCSKRFMRKEHCKTHMLTHTGEKPFKCDVCSKKFRTKHILRYHMCPKNVHALHKPKPFKCEFCFKQFTRKHELNDHMRVHTGEKPFKCDVCLKQYSSKTSLTIHIRIHTGEKPFKCEVCSKRFARNDECKNHMLIHTGEKPFTCDVCSKTFTKKSVLGNHMICHGEKRFNCEICLKQFTKQDSLKRHMKCHQEKRFECEICSKRFYDLSDLHQHDIVHTGEKPFKCDICTKQYVKKSTLNRHKRIHSGEKPLNP